jgi:hypothetical protein
VGGHEIVRAVQERKEMKGLVLHTPFITRGKKLPLLALVDTLPCAATISRKAISPSCKFFSNFSQLAIIVLFLAHN